MGPGEASARVAAPLSLAECATVAARSAGCLVNRQDWARLSFLDALRPEPGWRTDFALLATYSVHLVALVAALLARRLVGRRAPARWAGRRRGAGGPRCPGTGARTRGSRRSPDRAGAARLRRAARRPLADAAWLQRGRAAAAAGRAGPARPAARGEEAHRDQPVPGRR